MLENLLYGLSLVDFCRDDFTRFLRWEKFALSVFDLSSFLYGERWWKLFNLWVYREGLQKRYNLSIKQKVKFYEYPIEKGQRRASLML